MGRMHTWNDEKRLDMYRQDRVYFPLYLKSRTTLWFSILLEEPHYIQRT